MQEFVYSPLMITVCRVALLATALASAPLTAQQPPGSQAPAKEVRTDAPARAAKPLTNDTIISLVKRGLSDEAIIEMIRTSATEFDLSMVSVGFLAQAGVRRGIVDAMKAATSGAGTPRASGDSSNPRTAAVEPRRAICVAVWCW
jgi:nucleoid-associated protein YgaU